MWNRNDETNFLHKLLLTDTQVSKICKTFGNGLSAKIKLWKTQLSKMIQSGGIIRGTPIFENISSSVTDQTEQQSVSKEQI